MSAVEEIRIKLETRLDVLEEEIESLRSALTALDVQERNETEARNETAAGTTTTRPTRRRGATSSRASRAAAAAAELERQLAETGGTSAVELARETGTDYGEVLARIQELERAGRGRQAG